MRASEQLREVSGEIDQADTKVRHDLVEFDVSLVDCFLSLKPNPLALSFLELPEVLVLLANRSDVALQAVDPSGEIPELDCFGLRQDSLPVNHPAAGPQTPLLWDEVSDPELQLRNGGDWLLKAGAQMVDFGCKFGLPLADPHVRKLLLSISRDAVEAIINELMKAPVDEIARRIGWPARAQKGSSSASAASRAPAGVP